MNLESSLNDLKNLHTATTNQSRQELLLELVWEMTDIVELELPSNWTLLDIDDQNQYLYQLIVINIRQELLDEYVEEQRIKRVEDRQNGITNGYSGGI